jgi:PAS domain S-box-containing protein
MMLERLRKLATPPVFPDENKTRVAWLLHHICIVLFVGLAMSGVVFAMSGTLLIWLPTLVVTGAIYGGVFYIVRSGRTQFASLILVLGGWLVITNSAFNDHGIRAPIFGAYVLVILLSAILISEKSAIWIAAMSILAAVAMVYLERQGQLPGLWHPETSSEISLVTQSSIFVCAVVLIYTTGRTIRRTIERLQASEQQLAERNRELECQINERVLAEAERDRIFDMSLDILVVASFDGYLKRLNPAMERITGYTREELLAKPFIELSYPEDVEKGLKTMSALQNGTPMINYEHRTLTKDGRVIWLAWNSVAVNGMIYGIGRDISAQKEKEQQALELALAKQKAIYLTEFLDTISHDLKTPLSVLNTGLYLLERLNEPEKQRDKIQQLKEQTQILQRFIQDILMVSRLEHVPDLERQTVHINVLLSEIAQQLRPKAEKKRIVTRLELADGIPTIAADREQIQRAFTNLVENAIDYTPEGGSVDVRTRAVLDKVEVEIADTGIGIPAEDLPHIYDRYYRSQQARSLERGGTGLGLPIAKKIIDMHLGEIAVTSEVGQGTTFRVQIPRNGG